MNTTPIRPVMLALSLLGGLVSSACRSAEPGDVSGGSEGGTDDTGGTDDAGEDDGAPAGACADDLATLEATPMRRLTPMEYQGTIEILLGLDASAWTQGFPDEIAVDGFTNNVTNQAITLVHASAYQAAAEGLAAQALATAPGRDALVGCDPQQAACVEEFVARFGRMAFRRPLAPAQLEGLLALAATVADEPDPYAGIQIVIEAVLQSPAFLFRPEVGVPVDEIPTLHRLDGYEVASRLSFTLLRSTPPEWLLDAAEAGELDTADGVRAAALDLLEEPRAEEGLRAFAREWLRLADVEQLGLDPGLYPQFDDALRAAAIEEVDRLLDDHLWSEGSFLDLYRAPYVYADADLAAVYGLPAPAGEGLQRIDLPEDLDRGGLFSTAAFAMQTSSTTGPSITQRGRNVRLLTMCQPPPAPPDDLDTSPLPGEGELEGSSRRLESENCATCHQLMDPIGQGLYRYDAIGALRTVDEDGIPVPSSGEVVGIEGGTFEHARQLGELVASSPAAARCVAVKLFRHGFGRLDGPADACTVDALTQAFEDQGQNFSALVEALAGSDAMRFRPAPDSL